MNATTQHVTRSGFVALVGPTNAGKSTLMNAFLGEKLVAVSPKPQTTRDQIRGVVRAFQSEIVFVDSPGFEGAIRNGALAKHLRHAISTAASDVDFVVLTLDGPKVEADPRHLPNAIEAFSNNKLSKPRIVVLNKVDRLPHDKLLPLLANIAPVLEQAFGFLPEIVPVSAKKRSGIRELLKLIASFLPEGPAHYPEETKLDAREEFIIGEMIREKLVSFVQQELPYSSAVRVEHVAHENGLLRVGAAIFVERESQKGIVIGKGGEQLKQIGSAARRDLERFFQKKVFLQLHVRVEEDWTKTEHGVRKAGYGATYFR